MSSWEPVVILKTNVSVQDVYHGLGTEGFTRCGRRLSITSLPHWRWKYADAGWVRPCARCFADSNQESSFPGGVAQPSASATVGQSAGLESQRTEQAGPTPSAGESFTGTKPPDD